MKNKNIKELVIKTRTFRRFKKAQISRSTLREIVDLGRLSASGGNLQPLKYYLSADPKLNALIFPCLKWAGYLKEWPGPSEGERPSAYIIILGDTTISKGFGCDYGIAAQSIMLGATESGLGGCIIGSMDRTLLRKSVKIAKKYEIILVLALGKPKEKVLLESVRNGNIKYWRDAKGKHHVPKRSLNEIIIK